jgi:NAD(P)H-dependent FMN reductase
MKAIGIMGSPRKNGNVDTLVQVVLDGARDVGYQTSKYNLNAMKYSGCQACGYCKDEDYCRLDDDASKLLKDTMQADAMVFGSLIYFYQFTGQFKLFEDRMYSLVDAGLNTRLKSGKKAIIVTIQGNPDLSAFEKAANEFSGALKLLGFRVTDIIRRGGGSAPDVAMGRKDSWTKLGLPDLPIEKLKAEKPVKMRREAFILCADHNCCCC